MSRLLVAPIVEGHGEYESVRILLDRVWRELLGGEHMEVLRPIREKRNRLAANKNSALARAVQLAAHSLEAHATYEAPRSLVLVLVDADDDRPCILGPAMRATALAARSDANVSCVIANVEYETSFVAAAESLSEFIQLRPGEQVPLDPESARSGKRWVAERFARAKYSEPISQPQLTAKFDLALCRSRSPSFDKLCRDLERFVTTPPGD